MTRLFCILFFIATTASCASNPVVSVSVGDAIDVTALESQHGEIFDNPATIELLMYVNGMAARDIVLPALEKIDVTCMNEGRVAYVADISGMPALISRLVAVPRMRDYPYTIWLDYDGASTERLPAKEANVSLLDIKQGKIANIEFIDEESMLTKRLSRLCGEVDH